MYFKYGDYTHPEAEVNLVRMEIIPQFTPRGRRWAVLYRLHCSGELIADGQDAIKAKIDTFVNAYSANGQAAGLYHSDGTPTRHFLPSGGNNISRNRVAYRSWPRGAPDEYATARTYYVIIEGLFLEEDSQVYHWQETVQFHGNAGPQWRWHPTSTGQPIQQITSLVTTQRIVQWGSITGISLYPTGNLPPPILPQWEHEDLRDITYGAPKYFGNSYNQYPLRWRYVMETPPGFTAIPGTPEF